MDRDQTLHTFWSGFGLRAYEENAVPTGKDLPAFPYLTYTVASDFIGTETALTASLWYKENSWMNAVRKSQEIAETLGYGGVYLPCENGAIWLKRGSPWSQRMGDPESDQIKRINLNISAEYTAAL